MIISPQGKVLAEAQEPGSIAKANIDPFSGREGGDALDWRAWTKCRGGARPFDYGMRTIEPPTLIAARPLSLRATRMKMRYPIRASNPKPLRATHGFSGSDVGPWRP